MDFKIYRYWGTFSLLTLLIGIISGVAAIFFKDLISFFHNILFYGNISINYDFFKHAERSPWGLAVIFVPVMGGVIVTFLIRHFAPEAKGDGVPEVIDAIHFKHGEMRPPVSVIKALTSAICIGSGGSVGREGPVIQIGAAIGSGLAKWLKLERSEKITLIAAGASAALAATFNTPIGGVFLQLKLCCLSCVQQQLYLLLLQLSSELTYVHSIQVESTFFLLLFWRWQTLKLILKGY
jgi:CIC family chloride channel protein